MIISVPSLKRVIFKNKKLTRQNKNKCVQKIIRRSIAWWKEATGGLPAVAAPFLESVFTLMVPLSQENTKVKQGDRIVKMKFQNLQKVDIDETIWFTIRLPTPPAAGTTLDRRKTPATTLLICKNAIPRFKDPPS
ncbi:hypothetical protein L1887_20415 [Cichorium endivia]|nr:hypothetical protein L1887_20415 [Cichorium endivia]